MKFLAKPSFLIKGLALPFLAIALLLSFAPQAAIAQYVIDDGTAENSVGLTNGGDVIALNSFATLPSNNTITSISIAFGSGGASAGNTALNGLSFTAVLWSDPNGDGSPIDAAVLATAVGVVSGAGTNAFITLNIPATLVTTANFFVGFKITHPAGSFPGALDTTLPTFANRSFIAGGAAGTGNINNLALNTIPPTAIEAAGFAGNFLIRANGAAASVPEGGSSALLLGLSLLAVVAGRRALNVRTARCAVRR
jgi:hypothetical protein